MSQSTQISFSYENPLKARFGEEYFKTLPSHPAVYYFLDRAGRPLYIGKADNLKKRLMNYQAAKPGQVSEHILEMIEHAETIRWEEQKTGSAATKREAELIRAVLPPYNVALTEQVPYLYLGLQHARPAPRTPGAHVKVDFRLSNLKPGREFTTYGCFRHRGKTKAGYSALLRLMHAASRSQIQPRSRFALPAKICRSSPPYLYSTEMPHEFVEPLHRFLSGEDAQLLKLLLNKLLENTELPKQLYIPLQRDFNIAKEFFEYGPRDTRTLLEKAGEKHGRISRRTMDRIVAREFAEKLEA